jgi:hypothetical protein
MFFPSVVSTITAFRSLSLGRFVETGIKKFTRVVDDIFYNSLMGNSIDMHIKNRHKNAYFYARTFQTRAFSTCPAKITFPSAGDTIAF